MGVDDFRISHRVLVFSVISRTQLSDVHTVATAFIGSGERGGYYPSQLLRFSPSSAASRQYANISGWWDAVLVPKFRMKN